MHPACKEPKLNSPSSFATAYEPLDIEGCRVLSIKIAALTYVEIWLKTHHFELLWSPEKFAEGCVDAIASPQLSSHTIIESANFHLIYFQFPTEFIEKVHVLPDGRLLLSTLKTKGLLYILDPTSEDPTPKPAVQFDGVAVTGLSGIVPLRKGLIAVGGGIHTSFAFEKESFHVYIVSLETGTVVRGIPVPHKGPC
ncbi:hypothetical protein F5Y16DRAFT_62350 [Xylariaceae sp. FL0255]|nr:hypothetical protein F5Y16DRAFT_62350 [Xylariaceae sp. FL0255]